MTIADLMEPSAAERCAEILKALGHPIRLQLVNVLCSGERSVSELKEIMNIKQSAISQQLKILKLTGLVQVDRRSRRAFYSLAKPQIVNLLACLQQCDTHSG